MQKIRALLFDLDDTLLDHESAVHLSAQDFYRRHATHLNFSAENFLELWKQTSESYHGRVISGELPLPTARRMRMQEIFDAGGESIEEIRADSLYREALELYRSRWTTFEDVTPFFQRYAKIPKGIITNGSTEQQRLKLKDLGLVDTFDAIAISEELGHAKPSAAIFHAAVDMLQLPAACCLYVGNLEAHDARAAQAAGLFGVWLDRTLPGEYAVIGDLPVVSSLRHLPDVVEEFSLSIQLR